MYDRILVPIDGSPTATRGLSEAIKLANRRGGRLRLLHVVDELPAMLPPAGATDIVIAQLRSAGDAILKAGAAQARDAGVQVECKLLEEMGGEAGLHILEEAQSWDADLIVCGTHGRRGVRRVLMGSDAEYVVRRSSVPVLLVPSTALGTLGTHSIHTAA
jgi:nucleotide-binding universal stress UspA family protein